ncbi:MAG: methyltransferase domain-containing protein [Chloroflexi bacterium]|nr:methyltransferase domain-containing protein [Chloroflexota bacterium]
MSKKEQVKSQFGANAAKYATSKVHAKGGSLARLVELIQPQSTWRVLDIATAAGHTAFIFAPHVAHVTATDLTPEMISVAQKLATEKEISNITLETADAEDLPYTDAAFDLVTCRIAAHHFPHIDRFMAESARVLKPGGVLAVVDNVVPGSRLRGKKADLQRKAGAYVNAFEKLRDPSHGRALSLYEWQAAFQQAGFTGLHTETATKRMEFDPWADRMQVSAENKLRLRAMLLQAPTQVADFLTPESAGDRIHFQLTEAILIGKKAHS